MTHLRIVIAEDHYLVREGVRRILDEESGIEVVATVSTATELEAVASRTRPDVVVTDIRMPPDPHLAGIAAALRIRDARPGTGIVVLSQYSDPRYAMSLPTAARSSTPRSSELWWPSPAIATSAPSDTSPRASGTFSSSWQRAERMPGSPADCTSRSPRWRSTPDPSSRSWGSPPKATSTVVWLRSSPTWTGGATNEASSWIGHRDPPRLHPRCESWPCAF